MKEPMNGDELLALFEALANPHRLRIISILTNGRQYVSQLAREAEMSRPLLYMHLQKLEKAGMVKTEMEVSEDGKAMKYYELEPFDFHITQDFIKEAVKTLTIKKKEGKE
ncbi:ArsR/SmtB family transcription factor [Aliibacillus thermotolerans]|uniref:ArsR/SmtB family transcription factor n=1 Tax=Aliibacillus thermotolerans TaxID=1834418 RepID=A0ABW0U6Z8_9BACI|nr:winged helix-turn-helix domain-containing protein [Aliibacillus thermotolerans]MDA3129426.1 ArsR family transcriptional regulator [Aliibacillus thermotolerans]